MKRIHILCYSFLVALISITNALASENTQQSIVCIESLLADGETMLGTGFFIAPGIIVTVHHQVKEAKSITIHALKTLEKAKLILESNELAVLSINNKSAPNLLIDSTSPATNTSVSSYGCKNNTQTGKPEIVQSASGNITDPKRSDGDKTFIEANLAIKKGNSGGPLLTDQQTVIGIINGYDANNSQLSVSIPSQVLIQLMAQQKSIPFEAEITALWQHAQSTPDKAEQIKIYNDILSKTPWHTEAHYNQGMLYFAQQAFESAKSHFFFATQQRPSFYNAHVYLGMTLSALKDYAEARNSLFKAILIDSANPIAYSLIAGIYQNGLADPLSERNALQRYVTLETVPTKLKIAQKRLQTIEQSFSH